MRRIVLVVAVALLLTGCGPYAAAFTPSEELPAAEDVLGRWVADDGGVVELTASGFSVSGTDFAPAGSGRWKSPELAPTPFPYYELFYDDGEIERLYHQNGSLLGEESLYFSRGVVDDGDWYRLHREE